MSGDKRVLIVVPLAGAVLLLSAISVNAECAGECFDSLQRCKEDSDCSGYCQSNGTGCWVNPDCAGICAFNGSTCWVNSDCVGPCSGGIFTCFVAADCPQGETCLSDCQENVCLGNFCVGGNDRGGACVPTVSEWSLIVMALLVLTAGTIVLARWRRPAGA